MQRIRTFLLTLLTFIAFQSLRAQEERGLYLYGDIGGGFFGNFNTFKMSFGGVIRKDRTLNLAFYRQWAYPDSYPFSYHNSGAGLFGGDVKRPPRQTISQAALTYGKLFTLHRMMRFNLRGGVVFGRHQYPFNFRRNYRRGLFGESHIYDRQYKTLIGVIANPTIELPVFYGFGFNAGIFTIASNQKVTYGVELTMMFGKIREEYYRD